MAFTAEQLTAIKARGKVLVSASAGAGKTTVMIKRLADILAGGADLDNVLAVTFTKKAAAQIKEKLRAELIARLSEGDESARERIRVQLAKINSADISTIDSFCMRLVRTYFYALDGVPAAFDIADDAAAEEMQSRAMDNLFDKLYGKDGEGADVEFLFLLDRLKRRRSDDALREIILAAYKKIRTEPDYVEIVNKAEATFSAEGYAAVCARLGELIGDRCARLAKKAEELAPTFRFASGGDKYSAVLCEATDTLDYVAKKRDIFDRPEALTKKRKPNAKPENADEDARFSALMASLKKQYTKLFEGVGAAADEERTFMQSGAVARAFSRILMQFDGEYMAVKRDEGLFDYADLEHFCYALICKDGGADRDVKEQIVGKYSYVFVDEYQDVNPIQDAILGAVANGDVFKVGDVKQAIYGFRGSRSQFFGDQLKKAAEEGKCVILPHNFRSNGRVIDFVNELFRGVMTKELCGFDYAEENHAMVIGNAQNADKGTVEIRTFEKEKEEKLAPEGIYSITEDIAREVRPSAVGSAIVNLIEELLQTEIYDADSGGMRRVQQGDICVLARKKKSDFVQEAEKLLLAKGYSVDGAAETDVCGRVQIKRLLGVLSYIDNSEQDVALATALLSPLGNLTEDDLAAIRLRGGLGRTAPPFRRCAEKYAAEAGDALAEKLNEFYKKTKALRALADSVGAAGLIDVITEDGAFAAVFADEAELACLRLFQAQAYSSAGELSLNAFLSKLKATGNSVTAKALPSSDSIKILTMHTSKGLEYPIVIIPDITVSFEGEKSEPMPYDEEFGFAPYCYEEKSRVYRATLLRKLTYMRRQCEDLKNEINLFYVACTRAKSSLYLLSSAKKDFDGLGVFTASSYAELFDAKTLKTAVIRPIYAGEPAENAQNDGAVKAIGSFAVDGELYKKLDEIFAKNIYTEYAELPVKSSATKLLSLAGEEDAYPVLFETEGADTRGASAERGTAYHRFLQLCDFSVKDEKGVKKELERFVSEGLITAEQAGLLEVTQLKNILSMEIFSTVAGGRTYREREFLCAITAPEYTALSHGELPAEKGDDGHSVIVQGAIDLLAVREEGGEVIGADIVDYKFSSRPCKQLAEKYAPQLALYKRVVSRICNLPEDKISTTIINIRTCDSVKLHL